MLVAFPRVVALFNQVLKRKGIPAEAPPSGGGWGIRTHLGFGGVVI
jgi:hypothetical protein